MSSDLPPPFLGADPLRPPPSDRLEADPMLAGYGAEPEEPAGEAPGVPIDADTVQRTLAVLFDTVAQIRGPHWHAEPGEFALAAPAIARELNKPDTWFAAWLQEHADGLLIVAGLGVVIVPRAAIEYQVLKLRRDELRRELEREHGSTEPGAGARTYTAGPASSEPVGGPGPDLSEVGGSGDQDAFGRPSDPGAVAASITGIIGS